MKKFCLRLLSLSILSINLALASNMDKQLELSQNIKTHLVTMNFDQVNNLIEELKINDKELDKNKKHWTLCLYEKNFYLPPNDLFRTLITYLLQTDSTIKHLDLRNQQIGINRLKLICDLLKKNTSINSLTLTNNNIGDQGLDLLENALKENRTLKNLFVRNNKLSHKKSRRFTNNLKSKKDFSVGINVVIDLQKMNQLIEELKVSTLTELDLHHKDLTLQALESLTSYLKTDSKIKSLNLNSLDLDSPELGFSEMSSRKNWIEAVSLICDLLKRNNTLQNLFLDSEYIWGSETVLLMKALEENNSLKYLSTGRSTVNNEELNEICKSLWENNSLTSLNFKIGNDVYSGNNVKEKINLLLNTNIPHTTQTISSILCGEKYIERVLKSKPTELIIDETGLKDYVLSKKFLFDHFLNESCILNSLYITFNRNSKMEAQNKEDVIKIFDILKTNHTLKKLMISREKDDQYFSEEVGMKLGKMIQSNDTLTNLYISNFTFNKEALDPLKNGFLGNKTLLKLNILNSKITNTDCLKVTQNLLKSNYLTSLTMTNNGMTDNGMTDNGMNIYDKEDYFKNMKIIFCNFSLTELNIIFFYIDSNLKLLDNPQLYISHILERNQKIHKTNFLNLPILFDVNFIYFNLKRNFLLI